VTINQTSTVKAVRRREIVPTRNELFWIEVIRTGSRDTDPEPTLALAQKLRCLFRTHLVGVHLSCDQDEADPRRDR
jgi:hypothetical protein